MPGVVPSAASEREELVGFLDRARLALRVSVRGLSDEQARASTRASLVPLGSHIMSNAGVHQTWIGKILARPRGEQRVDGTVFRMGPGETLAEVLSRYDDVARTFDATIAGIPDLTWVVPVPADEPWHPPDLQGWTVRWILFHLLQATSVAVGRAELTRMSIDGETIHSLQAALERA